jgi:predicted SprT family Zn-dependent metalloprotease
MVKESVVFKNNVKNGLTQRHIERHTAQGHDSIVTTEMLHYFSMIREIKFRPKDNDYKNVAQLGASSFTPWL